MVDEQHYRLQPADLNISSRQNHFTKKEKCHAID